MTAKKNPLKFTISFNEDVPAQAAAAEFLNRCGGHMKAHYIAMGLMMYLGGAGEKTPPVPEMASHDADEGTPPRAAERKRPDSAAHVTETGEMNGEAAGAAFAVTADPDGTLSGLSETDKAAIMESVMLMDDIAGGDQKEETDGIV